MGKHEFSKADQLDIANYKSKKQLSKPTPGTFKKWIKIYEDYAKGTYTTQELGEKYKLDRTYISKIIKYVVHHLNKHIDQKVYKQVMLDKLRNRIKKLENYLDGKEKIKPQEIKDITYLLRELRLTDRMAAQIQGIITSGASIDMSDKRKIVVVTKNLKRRRGAPEAPIEIEPDNDH